MIMDNFDYKKYSLKNLEKWIEDALSSAEASPQEIYDTIHKVVEEEYYCYKNHTGRCYDLLVLLNGGNHIEEQVRAHGELWNKEDVLREREYYEGWDSNASGESKLTCDKDDKSPECQKAWNDFWEENYYPEESSQHTKKVEDVMSPWGHSDMEALRYSEEELNAMCDKAASDYEKDKCREYNLREAEYYDKRAKLDTEYIQAKIQSNSPYNDGWTNQHYQEIVDKHKEKENTERKASLSYDEMVADGCEMTADGFWVKKPKKDKVVKWQLPVEVDGISGEYYIQFPDDLMEASGIGENDLVQWIDRGDGSFELRKVTKPIGMEEC